MGDKYAVGLQQTAVSSNAGADGSDACGELLGVATVRGRIYDIIFGQGGPPGDLTIRWQVMRAGTASATGAGAVENPLDPDAPASNILSEEEITASGTVQANSEVIDMDVNQRATFRWIAAPGSEIVIPAVATESYFFNPSNATYTGIARVTVLWEE
jgi:hypothetical protein